MFERYGKVEPCQAGSRPRVGDAASTNPESLFRRRTCSEFSGSVADCNGDAFLIYVLTDMNLAIREGCFGRRSRRTKSYA